jgi:phage tail sheath gpL-like
MGDIQIIGFSDSDKVPGFYGQTRFGQSPIQIGSITRKALVCGLKATGLGDIAVDAETRRIQTEADANTAFGIGSEGARMCYAALEEARGLGNYELWACAPTAAGGATAGTLILTVSGTATAVGTIKVWVGGDLVEIVIPNATAAADAAALINTEVAKYPKLPASATVLVAAVTFTHKTPSIRNNDCVVYCDFSQAPGLTVALSGAGTATTSSITLVGRKFGGGAGTETLTTLLSALFPTRFDFCAFAQNDATSLAALKVQCDAKAVPVEGRMEHYMTASSGNLAAATSLAQSTLNNWRFRLDHLVYSERAPAELAAAQAALRAAIEGQVPNSAYDDYELRWAVGQRFPADWVSSHAGKQAPLDVGVTPYETRANGKVYIVRSVTTRSLDGSTPDYRTLNTYDAFVPDYVRDRLRIVWSSQFRVANPYVRPDVAAGEPDPPAGVATPALWNSRITTELRAMESERVLTQVSANLPRSEYNYVANRIMSAVPSVPLPHQHQVGVQVDQLNVAA